MILYRTMTYYYNFYVSYFMLAFLMLQKVFHKTLQYLLIFSHTDENTCD